MTTIVSIEPIYAYFDVDEPTVLRIQQAIREGKLSRPAKLSCRSTWGSTSTRAIRTRAAIDFVDNRVDPETGTLKVRGVFPNKDEALSPGLHARIKLPMGKPHQALMVTERAIATNQGANIVYVVNDKNEAVERTRSTLRSAARRAARDRQRASSPDDRVIVNGLQRCRARGRRSASQRKMDARPSRTASPLAGKLTSPVFTSPGTSGRTSAMARFFIDRPIFAWVISIVIVLAGLAAVVLLAGRAVSRDHAADGAGHLPVRRRQRRVVADTVAAPIEQQVNGVEDMLYMSSQSTNDGTYNLTVTFKLGTSLDMAQVLVQNRVSQAMPTLPDVVKATGVTVKKRSPSILLVVNLYSEDNPRTGKPYYDQLYLSNYATIQVRDELARIDGVGDVTLLGQQDYSMRVWLDPNRLASRNLTAADIVALPARAERAGRRRPAWPAAGAQRRRFSVHHDHARPADRARAVRRHRGQDRRERRDRHG